MDDIVRIVDYIQNSSVPNKSEHFSVKYKNFKEKYPTLFEIACREEKIDRTMFNMMLEKAKAVKRKELSQHDASVEVGQTLYDKYVDPLIKNIEEKEKSA